MAQIVSEKEQDFTWLLIEIVNALNTEQQKDLVRAYKAPFTGDLIHDCHVVLNTLKAAKLFGAGNLEGLKKLLKILGREDLIKLCSKSIEKTRKAEKKASKTPTIPRKTDKTLDDLDLQLVQAKSQMCTLVGESSRALSICEEKLQQFRRDEISLENLQDQFRRFTNIVERSTNIIKNAISGGSLHSNKSDSGIPEQYHVGLVPKQETEVAEADHDYDVVSDEPPVQVVDEDGAYEIIDWTDRDNTGDSGIGSSGGIREEWLKGSAHQSPMPRREKPIPKPRRKLPPPTAGQYIPLLPVTRESSHSYTDIIRPSSADDILSHKLKD